MMTTLDDNAHDWGFFCGLLTGMTLGAGLAMIYAPKSGPEMRREIADTATNLGQAAKETWEDVSTTASVAVQKGREVYEQTRRGAEDVAESADQWRDRSTKAMADAANDLARGGAFPRH